MKKSDQIIANKIQTPDGTVLRSYHRHDYVSYVDKNGETYIADGGTDYLKRSVNKAPAKELSVYLSAPFNTVRKEFVWGSYGKSGKEVLRFIPLREMSNDHLENVLSNKGGRSPVASTWTGELFEKELKYRKKKSIVITD